MKFKILIPVIFLCGLVWITSCSPDEYEVDLSYGITHGIAMHNSDEHAGTFNFYQMIHYAMIDSGVSFNRTMDAILETSVPGGAGDGKYTVFVIDNDKVGDLSLAYFGNSIIQSGVNTIDSQFKTFKLLQFYFVVGEYKLKDLPAKLKMDNGYEINISGTTLTGFDGNQVHIVSGDNVARNGVFHVVDGPLHPTSPANFVDYNSSYFYSYAPYGDKTEYNPY